MWHLTIVKTVHGQRILFASLVIQLSQLSNQACYPGDSKLTWKVFLAPMLETCTTITNFTIHTSFYTLALTDDLNLPPNEILGKILKLKKKIEEINKDCKVIISTPAYRFDNRKAGNTVNELTNILTNLNVPIVNNKNISASIVGARFCIWTVTVLLRYQWIWYL